jgi:predicted dehydrogenase
MLKATGTVAAASALAAAMPASLYAAGGDTIQIALVGCGGRGSGAAPDAMNSKNGPVKLVAMADVFQDRLDSSYKSLERGFAKSMDVPKDRQFVGFDAYQKAMDCLKPGDIVILATPPAFRWVHFTYAIKKGLNVFMEKPITVDGPSTRKMLELGEEAAKKNLKVGVGLMCRHCDARNELFKRIKDGELGELMLLQAYRMHGPVGSAFTRPYNKSALLPTELLYQIRNFHSFLWASGGCYSDFYVHNIDECCWMKDAWPIKAQATGGRHYRGDFVDQNFDTYSVEYTFADGTKLYLAGRTMDGCQPKFASYAHGTKGCAVISERGHSPTHARTYSGFNIEDKSKISWKWDKPEPSPYQLEWDHLLSAIRNDKVYNEVKRGAQASLVTAMGRMAAHTGQVVTYEDMLKNGPELAAELDKLTMESAAPLQADKNGKYPTPQPGKNTRTEF